MTLTSPPFENCAAGTAGIAAPCPRPDAPRIAAARGVVERMTAIDTTR